MPGQCGGQQRLGVKHGCALIAVVAFFMRFTRQLGNVLGLQWGSQREERVNALEIGAGGLGVFADPVRQTRCAAQRAFGQNFGQSGLAIAAKIEWSRYQV